MNTVILMRHGQDAEGSLTDDGKFQVRQTAQQFIAAGIRPDLILHSPARRAEESAAILVDEYRAVGQEINCRQDDGLIWRKGTAILDSLLKAEQAQNPSISTVLLLTHQDNIDKATDHLIRREYLPDYAGACVLSCEGDWRQMIDNTRRTQCEARFPKRTAG